MHSAPWNATLYQCFVIKVPFNLLSAQKCILGSRYYSLSVLQINSKFLPPPRELPKPALCKQQQMYHSSLSQEFRRRLTWFPSKLFTFLSRVPFLRRRLSSGTAFLSPATSQHRAEYWVQLPVTTDREVEERVLARAQPISSPDITQPRGTCLPGTGSLMTPGYLIL